LAKLGIDRGELDTGFVRETHILSEPEILNERASMRVRIPAELSPDLSHLPGAVPKLQKKTLHD
jgi:hypothetical protein